MRTLKTLAALLLIVLMLSIDSAANAHGSNDRQKRLPVIDMHVHAEDEEGYNPKAVLGGLVASESPEALFKETYEQFRKWNVVKAVVSGPLDCVETWKSKDEDNRIIRGVIQFAPNDNQLDPVRLDKLINNGKIEVFGEIIPPLSGTKISDPEWQPYLKICEQYDIPLAIHTGCAPPAIKGTSTAKSRRLLDDPFIVEDVIVNYPKLRIYLCHSGAVYHERVLVLMSYYPRIYTDLGWVLWGDPLSRRYAREFLAKAKEAGCLDRVMFGSDQMQWPQAIGMSIKYLNSLDFLTEQDKRDILYNNAVRFLKLKE